MTIPHALDELDKDGHITNFDKAAGTDGKNTPLKLTAIPYYAWCNREKGPMTVWIKE